MESMTHVSSARDRMHWIVRIPFLVAHLQRTRLRGQITPRTDINFRGQLGSPCECGQGCQRGK